MIVCPQKYIDANAAEVMKFWRARDTRNRVLQAGSAPEPKQSQASEMQKFCPNYGGGRYIAAATASIDLMKPLNQLAQPDSRANHDANEGHRCTIGEGRECG
jgi:hypothetical protein